MRSQADKNGEPAAPSKKRASDTELNNKVPESAENFEHILRRIIIAKAKAKRQ